jgi:hypothetical protein
LVAKNGIYKKVNKGGLANESIFAIILQTFNELTNPTRLINEVCTITDWTRMSSPTSPYLFKEATDENLKIIDDLLKENKYTMFLRKVHSSFPENEIRNIMNTDFKHTYENTYNQATKHNNSSRRSCCLLISSLVIVPLFSFICVTFITSINTKIIMNM